MDPIARRSLLELVKNSINLRGSVLFTTHRLDEAEYLCNQIAILIDGKIVCKGSPEFLKNHYANSYLIMLQEPNIEISSILNNLRQTFHENEISIMSTANRQVLIKASKGPSYIRLSEVFRRLIELKTNETIKDFSLFEASLHQVFVQINSE